MSRNNNDLPMLPPWLSESDVTQSGYEAPVQNLPHDELIEEAPSRRRGRFKNRAPEAERPEAARPDKRRKGWRRDKHEPSEEGGQQSASRPMPAPGPDGPAPGPIPHDSWQQPTYDQAPPQTDNSWGARPQPADAPQNALPTRNPAQPSPGFQPLGRRPAEMQVSNDRSAAQQAGRPDLPPPPPLPDPPRQPNDERPDPAPNREYTGPSTGEDVGGRTTGPDRPPLRPQSGEWPSTGNPRLDAALSAVRPSHWPTNQMSPPPIDGRPVAPATGAGQTGADPRTRPDNEPPAIPPTGPNQTWPTSDHSAAPPGDRSAVPPHRRYPGTPQAGADHAPQAGTHPATPTGERPSGSTGTNMAVPPTGGSPAAQSYGERPSTPATTESLGASHVGEHLGASAGAEQAADRVGSRTNETMPPVGGQTPPTGSERVAPTADVRPVATGNQPAVSDTDSSGSSAAPGDRPAADERTRPQDDQSAVPPVGERPATPNAEAAPSSSVSTGGPTAAGSGGPPPWLAAPPPQQAATPTTAAPRRLPLLPDPPAPHERPHSGAPGVPTAPPPHDERRLPAREGDGPPPWLGHIAPDQAEQPSRSGPPPAPNETAAQADRVTGARTSADSTHSDAASEPQVRADRRPASTRPPADDTGTEAASAATPSATGPQTAHGGVGSAPPAPESASATGSPSTIAPEGTPPPNEATERHGAAANPPHTQRDLGAAASGWTSAAEVGAASARPIAGRHRLPTGTSELPVEQAPNFDQQPVAQQQTAPPYREAGNLAPGPHAPADRTGEYSGYPPQFEGGRAPVAGQPGPTDHWRDTPQHPSTGPADSTGGPASFVGGQAPVGEQPPGQWRHVAEQNSAQESHQAAPYSAPSPQQRPEPQNYGQAATQAGGQQWGNPAGYAQPPAQHPNPQPGTPFQQPSLDDVPLRRVKRAPGSGWRKAVHHVSGGAINPGMSAEERRLQELVARIRQPVRGDYRIAVLSLKGGVGKTTTTMGLGSIFASIRGDRVIAVDANPDFGTLSQRVPLQTRSTVRDLLLDTAIQRYSDVRRHTSQGTSRLEVLASERDPAASEAFSDEEYRAVAGILQRFYNIILTDCGTGLMHSAMTGVLDLAHSLVLISSAAIDGARSAAATLDWLSLHGHDHLVRNAVVVINLPREGSPNVGIQQLREYFLSRCRAVHIIPYDQHLSEGAEIDLHRLHKQTKRAYVELAATVADDFATDHRRYHP